MTYSSKGSPRIANLPDESDNHVIELAVAGGADAIVTHNKRDLVQELSTIAIVQHDAETRFRALAACGSVEAGLRILDKLDDSFREKTSDTVED